MAAQSNLKSDSIRKSPLKTILFAWIVAGTLDMSGALLVYTVIMHKITAIQLLQGIASGVFGKDAYTGGTRTALYGIIFHYFIAFCFVTFYFLVFPYLPFLRKQKIISGLVYGIFIWFVMNIILLPLIFTHRAPMTWQSGVIGASILILMIGMPVSFITHNYYTKKT
jgi:uncharacterized membrane protein YagU involved in acid resistance